MGRFSLIVLYVPAGVLSLCSTYTTAGKGIHLFYFLRQLYLFLLLFLHFFRDKNDTIEGVADRLEIGREESLTNWFGNPCPGVLKTLRIRYVSLEGVARGSRREVWLQETEVRRPRRRGTNELAFGLEKTTYQVQYRATRM